MAQVWVTAALGGHLTSPELSRNFRIAAQPLMRARQFVRPEQEFGQNRGDTLQFAKAGNVDTAGRVVGESETVPVAKITFYKSSITVDEFTNSIEYTWKLKLLAKLDVNSILIIALKNDMAKTLDKFIMSKFTGQDLKYSPTGTELNKSYVLNTNGTKGTATRNISVWDLKNIIDKMKDTYYIPLWDGANYMCMGSTTFMRGLKDDDEWRSAAEYGDPKRLFDGEVGKFYGCRMAEETNSLSGNLTGGLGEAVIFGDDPVVEISAYPEEIQAKIGVDYGRDAGLRWVWIGGASETWDFSTEGDARVIHVTSA
jgi:N4-gp56 family major capsid protein